MIVRIIRDYPAEHMVTLISCTFVTLQSAFVALAAERDPNAWKLRPDLELFGMHLKGPII
ncbi:unnamed protein product [Ilex paraguariensis]|uniref:Uncharacterized protein n=1 Tax=Ilex paraguariensis TaxID=185542 RepID=A0ABC8S2B9_9AQUA